MATTLTGEVALVTGASSGLGRRFAEVLAAAGADVVVAARRADRLEEVVRTLEESGARAIAVPLDVRDPHSIVAAVDTCEERLGVPTILVNNAGLPDARRAHRMPLDLVDAVIETNVRGPWLLATEVAGRLIRDGRAGRIVNITSMSAFQYMGEGAALYSMSKAALNRMTEVLAVEWAAHGINVNAIAPGVFSSEMTDGLIDRVGDPTPSFPRRRLGRPDGLDSTLLYLTDPRSDLVTGAVLKVDDAQYAR